MGAIILFVNAIMSYFVYKIDYASDTEWSRYILINIISCCGLMVFNAFEYINVRLN